MESAEMTVPAPPSDEDRLGFTSIVLAAFEFVERLGFIQTVREGLRVRFESESVYLDIFQGRLSYNVGVEIGRLQGDDVFTLQEVVSALAPEAIDRIRCQASTRGALQACIREVASVVEVSCASLLRNEEHVYRLVRELSLAGRRDATLRVQFGAIVERADEAWEAKDLERAKTLYERAVAALDENRARRLAYLRKWKERNSGR